MHRIDRWWGGGGIGFPAMGTTVLASLTWGTVALGSLAWGTAAWVFPIWVTAALVPLARDTPVAAP